MTNLAAEARALVQAKYPGAAVHSRGRSWIKHQHPTDPERKILQTQGGPMHYGPGEDQEIDTAWQVSAAAWDYEAVENDFRCYVRDSVPVSYRYEDAVSGHFVELTWNAVEWTNDEGDSENAASFVQVPPVIDDERITWSEIATGWNVCINAQTARIAKLVTIDSLDNLGAPTIGGTNPALQFRLAFQKSSGLEIWADGEQWSEKNNTWIETATDLEFRDETTQESIFWFKKPWAADQDGDVPIVTQRTKKTGNNFYAEIDIPWSWLQSASRVYPIEIDPTVDTQVAASADDATEDTGTVTVTATTAFINTTVKYCGCRWPLAIAQGATIDVAYMSYYSTVNNRPVDYTMYIEDEDTAAAFTTTTNDISGRTAHGTSVNWNNGGVNAGSAEWIDTDSLTVPIEAVIGRGGWASGNYLCGFYTERSGGAAGMVARMYDGVAGEAPKIYIEYSTGGSPYTLEMGQGSYTLTGQAVALKADRKLAVGQGTYALTGQAVGLTADRSLAIGQGSYALTGQDVGLSAARSLAIGQGSYALTGQDVGLIADRSLAIGQGSYTLTGQDVSLLAARMLAMGQGSYVLTGQDITLTYTPVGGYTLIMGQGSYALTGQDVALAADRTLAIDQGSYALTGQSMGLVAGRRLAMGQGSYLLSGQDVSIVLARVLVAAYGSYVLTGQAVALTYSGAVVTAPASRTFIVPAESRVFIVHQDLRQFIIDAEGRTFTVSEE